MTLIVEDGTGLSTAESYSSVAATQTYAASRGLAFDSTDELSEQALRRATTWLDSRYRSGFSGYPVHGREQMLEWPRHDAYDADGYYIPYTSVPREVIQATQEAAVRELAVPGSLSPDLIVGQLQKKIVVGPIEIEYANQSEAYDNRPISTVIDDILGGLLVYSSGTTKISGESYRV